MIELPGRELENDPEGNPCFACGPRNPVGLRMRFFDDGRVVRSALALDERYGGSHDIILQGILYSAVDDALYWTAWARLGELPWTASDGPSALRYPGAIRVDEPFVVEAWVERRDGDLLQVHGHAKQGETVGCAIEWAYRRRTMEEIEGPLARARLPRSTRAELDAMRARRRARAADGSP